MSVCNLPEGQASLDLPTMYEELNYGRGAHARENVKIQDGCNNFCSYCLVPYLRGRSRSRSLRDVVEECVLRSATAHEIVLTGINTAAYGTDIGVSLTDLVKALAGIKCRFRFGSLEANVIDADLLEAMKGNGNFCDHFHLSLQSGSDDTLKAMNRHYTTLQFAEKVSLIRDYFPLASITTDVIVGFPTETERQFQESLDFVTEMAFANMHVFPYSRRQGTKAYALAPINPAEMQRRVRLMTEVKEQLHTAFLHSFIGYELEVVTEHQDDMYMQGHTANYIKVYIPVHTMCKPNSVYTVRCLTPYMDGMLAEIVS
jgi:threonylcarbamoyladenosine tRNA methylthiotransferase MtaB